MAICRTSYGAAILYPTGRPCISLDKIIIVIIITIIIVIFVTDFSDTEPRVMRLYNAAAAIDGMVTTSVCVPTSKCRDGGGSGGGCFFFFASVSV